MKGASKMELEIQNNQIKIKITEGMERIIENSIKKVLLELDIAEDNVEVSIVLTDNESIRDLNNEYRGIDSPTDVLSFPLLDGSLEELDQSDFISPLGDIVISMEKVISQAQDYGHSPERELGFLIVHGMLHLLGYDHIEPEDERTMRDMEEKILEKLELTRD